MVDGVVVVGSRDVEGVEERIGRRGVSREIDRFDEGRVDLEDWSARL